MSEIDKLKTRITELTEGLQRIQESLLEGDDTVFMSGGTFAPTMHDFIEELLDTNEDQLELYPHLIKGLYFMNKELIAKASKARFYCNDLGKKVTIKEYLKELLKTLWKEEESFCGKRPFGNSGWARDLYKPLVEKKIIKGHLDEDGYIEECDFKQGDKVILAIIKSL